MPTPTVTLSVLVLPAAREALRRLALVTRWSQSKLVEHLILNLERGYTGSFSEAELERYQLGHMTHIEFRETQIRRRHEGMRSVARAGADAPVVGSPRHEPVPDDAAASPANDTGPVKYGSVA